MHVPEAHDSRGQVGIGTLIIFIAMVLVAAVAAGVLINTAGMLEAKASDTSQDSQAQVSNHIVVVSAVGEVDPTGANDTVTSLNLTLMKAAGAGDMDLGKASYEYISDDAAVSLDQSHTAVNLTNTDNSSSVVLNSRDDRIVLTIRVNDTDLEGPGGLKSGQKAMITIVTASGAKSLYGVNVPQTISDEKYVKV